MSSKHKLVLEELDRFEREEGPHLVMAMLRAAILADQQDEDHRAVEALVKSTQPKRPWWRFWR